MTKFNLCLIVFSMLFIVGCSIKDRPQSNYASSDSNISVFESSVQNQTEDNDESSFYSEEDSEYSIDNIENSQTDVSTDIFQHGEYSNPEVSDTDMESNWKLVVNGVDITQEYYAEKMSDGICLPFVAVMETLGAEFTWETDRKAEMKYLDLLFALDVDECSFISKANGVELFGVMGGGLFVSVPMDKELLLDSARVRYFFKNAGITFERNYDEKIVAINGDPNHIPGNALTESVYFY